MKRGKENASQSMNTTPGVLNALPMVTNAELAPWIMEMVSGRLQIHHWQADGSAEPTVLAAADGFFVYGHPIIDGAVMDSMPNLRVITTKGLG